ncbi:unnamed protein product [Clavelina lepadiformis]|uniref:Uncharacterized protein n=1 Tax=Clavelina lepadiformis TaxID=159417 RepID=A0ABP0GZU7_CLALP
MGDSKKNLQNPASPGSSAVVTSAEQISQEVSAKLLSTQNATSGIKAEADSIGFWIDFEPKQNEDQNTNVRLSEAFRRLFGSSISNQIRILSPYYTFPNKEVMPARVTLPPTSMWTTGIPVNSEEEGDFFEDSITLPRAALGTKSVVTNVRYKNLDHSMPTRKSDDRDLPKGVSVRFSKVNSAVLTTSVHPRPDKVILENDPVIIVFKHHREARGNLTENANATQQNETSVPSKKPPPYYRTEKIHCVFWKEGNDEKDGGSWSTDGCIMSSTNETHTVCSCTHLTSFAVLLQIVEYNMEDELSRLHLQVLGIISKVGCVFSLIGVSIMCAAFVKLKFHTDNMKIHFHLGLAVGLADLVFIFEELAEDSRAECILVTILLYYFNMAVLAWMLIEGVHLYSQVVVVFVSARRWVKYYVGAGWGVPLFIMAISMGVRNVELGTYGVCWLSPADNSIWAFAAPALLVILINTVILITVVRVIINLQPAKSNRVKAAKLRNAVKGSIFLFPLLGTTWLFGLLSLSQETLLFQYIFALTNSLQGFFLFVFHCLCNSEVREDARRHKWFGAKKVPLGLGSPPPQSSLLSLSVTNGIRRFRNSISFEMPTSSTGESDNNSEEESSKNGNFGKLLSLFPRVFVAKMPETIEEEINEKDVEGMDTSKPPLVVGKSSPTEENVTEDKKQPEVSERPLQLPGMPVKNDRITLPLETQKKLDQMLSERMANSATKELCKESEMNMKKDVEMPVFDEADEKRKMEMSYDSGLNSIDNESILDEEDDVWMANQQKQLQELQDRSPGLEFPKQADTQN